MKAGIVEFAIGGCVACVAFLTLMLFASCSSPQKTAAEADYLSQQLSRVDAAKTLEESHICRALVKAKWGRDAAAPVAAPVKDGGAE